jgi:hypothetical protein
MVSVEASKKIERRVRFNRPFRLIQLRMASIGEVIPTLRQNIQHLLWLDYDSTIRTNYLADLTQAIAHCAPGSIILITVDVEAPKGTSTPREIREHYESQFGELLPPIVKPVQFSARNLPMMNVLLLSRAIQRGITGRAGLEFQPLFNFIYQDGHKMLTLGGMIKRVGNNVAAVHSHVAPTQAL